MYLEAQKVEEQTIKNIFKRKRMSSSHTLMLEYRNYVKQKKMSTNHRTILSYKGIKLALTLKQIQVLQLIAKGFSNTKIAYKLGIKETTIKLLVYRLMKYLDSVLGERIDRFYLVIIAQELNLEHGPYLRKCNPTCPEIQTMSCPQRTYTCKVKDI